MGEKKIPHIFPHTENRFNRIIVHFDSTLFAAFFKDAMERDCRLGGVRGNGPPTQHIDIVQGVPEVRVLFYSPFVLIEVSQARSQ